MSSTTTMGVRGYARVCVGMRRGAQCGRVCIGVHWCAQVFVKVCGCLRVCAWDEFSECLLENRVPTSADFNTYPIRILIFTLHSAFLVVVLLALIFSFRLF